MLQVFVKLEVSSFTWYKYIKEVPKFKKSAPDPDQWPRPFWVYFVILEKGLAKIYLYKFKVSTITCSKYKEGVLKFSDIHLQIIVELS